MEINDLENTNIETREITDLANSEYENYTVTDLINIPMIVGPQGPPNVLRIGEVKTGDKSAVNIRGDSPNQILDFTLEKGDKGETGESGVYIGNTEPTDEAIKVWIQPDGQGSNILKIRNSDGQFEGILSIKGDQGIPGQDGKDGEDGSPGPVNTLTIGTVQSGDNPSASITGEAPNQVLNLVLVKGDTGNTGPQGQQGPPGTPAKNYIIETTNRTIETEITQNTNYQVPTYEVGTNSLSVYFEGSKLIKNINYIEVDSTHIQFKDWNVPVGSSLEIIIRKEEE